MNVQGVFLHLLGDLFSSVGVLLAAIAVGLWHWAWADSAISIVVGIIVGASAVPLLRQSVQRLRPGSAIADLSSSTSPTCICCTPVDVKKLFQPSLKELI